MNSRKSHGTKSVKKPGPSATDPLQIVVLGMHRSGTSALTGALGRMGIYLGDKEELTAKSWQNPQGFYERRDARQICDALLQGAESEWWKVSSFDPDNIDPDVLAQQRKAIGELVAGMNERAPHAWAIKEPRLCHLFPVFRSGLTNPFVVLVSRNPMEVARSLRRRNGFPIHAGLALWECYMTGALQHASQSDHVMVNYHELVSEPKRVLSALADALKARSGMAIDVDDAVHSIDSTFYRERASGWDMDRLSAPQSDLWVRLKEGACSGDDLPRFSGQGLKVLREFEVDQRSREAIKTENRALKKQVNTLTKDLACLQEQKNKLDEDLEAAKSANNGTRSVYTAEKKVLEAEKQKLANELAGLERKFKSLKSEKEYMTNILAGRERARRASSRKRVLRDLVVSEKRLYGARGLVMSLIKPSGTRDHRALVARAKSIASSPLFDSDWYLEENADVRDAGMNPALHYVLHGAEEGRAPSAIFDPEYYSTQTGIDRWPEMTPLEHYLAATGEKKRSPNPGFDSRWYSEQNPDVADAGVDLLEHFVENGILEGRSPHPDQGNQLSERKPDSYNLTIAVIAWDVGHNPLGRAYMIAEALSRKFNVILFGPGFSRYGKDIWEPVRNARLKTIRLAGCDFPEFIEKAKKLAHRLRVDGIVACKARFPSVLLAYLAKNHTNIPVFVDVDDYELSFFKNRNPLPARELEAGAKLPDAGLPYGETWTRHTETLLDRADGLFVSNVALQEKFGGQIVPHARDERIFNPDRFDRADRRRRFGIAEEERIVLFLGTPRAHKGVLEVLRAVRGLADDKWKMCVIGDPHDDDFRKRLMREGGDRLYLLPDQPFDELAANVQMADLVVLLQNPESEISKYQLPAKAIDCLAMGVPVLATETPPLQPLIEQGAVIPVSLETLDIELERAADRLDSLHRRQIEKRSLFINQYSYAAISDTMSAALLSAMPEPRELSEDWKELVERTLDTDAGQGKKSTLKGRHIVMFWKQSDTGLYGRRHEMLAHHLSRNEAISGVTVFDLPVSFEDIHQKSLKKGVTHDRQIYELVFRREWGWEDEDKLRFRNFIYSNRHEDRGKAINPPWRRDQYAEFIAASLEDEGISATDAIFWFYPKNPDIETICEKLKPWRSVVDVVDDHRTWDGISEAEIEKLTAHYRAVCRMADVVLANCKPVKERMETLSGRPVHLIENACDIEGPVEEPGGHQWAEFCNDTRPKLGYVGNLEVKIDFDLLEWLAQRNPEWQIYLIGSAHANPRALRLGVYENIHLIGVVPYRQVRGWISRFDVALIPHEDTAKTQSMNPLKMYVYLSQGVPVVSTAVKNLGALARFVDISHTKKEFEDNIKRRLTERDSQQSAQLHEQLEKNSWKRRVVDIVGLLE